MKCPRCQHEVPDGPECSVCGVVVAKYRPRQVAAATPVADERPSARQLPSDLTAPASASWMTVSARRRALFYGELARLLQAGVSPYNAFTILEKHTPRSLSRAAQRAREKIQQGGELWEALALSPQVFPPRAVSLIAAAERTGSVPTALAALAQAAELKFQLRLRLVRAALYPFILFTLSFFLLPLASLITEGVGGYLRQALIPYLWSLLGLGVVFWLLPRLLQTLLGHARAQEVARAIPLAGRLLRAADRAEFCRQLAGALGAGLDVAAALRLAALSTGLASLERKVEKVIAHVERGGTLAQAFADAGLMDRELDEVLATGEASGKLPEALEQQARLSEQAYLHGVEVGVQLLAVVLLLVVYAVVVFRVIGQYTQVLESYQGQMKTLLKEIGGGGAGLENLLRGGGQLPPELREILK